MARHGMRRRRRGKHIICILERVCDHHRRRRLRAFAVPNEISILAFAYM